MVEITESHTLLIPWASVLCGRVFDDPLFVTFDYTEDSWEEIEILSIYDSRDTDYMYLTENDDELHKHMIVCILNNKDTWDLGVKTIWWAAGA